MCCPRLLLFPTKLGFTYLPGLSFTGQNSLSLHAGTLRSAPSIVSLASCALRGIFTSCLPAYLLENGSMYHIAHATALVEYIVTSYLFPQLKSYPYISQVGLVVLLLGQTLRSCAMIHASTNFSHAVAFYKVEGHRLVTDGVYRFLISIFLLCCILTSCQLVPPSILRRLLLLGFGDPTPSSEPHLFFYVLGGDVEILLLPNSR